MSAFLTYVRRSVRVVVQIRYATTFLGLAGALILSLLLVPFASMSVSNVVLLVSNGRLSVEGPLLALFALPLLPHWFAATVILFEDYFLLLRIRRFIFGDQALFRERLANWSAEAEKED